jgi:hypothetical protein
MINDQPIAEVKEWILNHKLTAKVPKAAKKNDKEEEEQSILGKRTHDNLE